MQTGRVEANLVTLNEAVKLPYIAELIEQKTTGPEKGAVKCSDLTFFESEFHRLRDELKQASENSHLPEDPTGSSALNDLLIRVRLTADHTQT